MPAPRISPAAARATTGASRVGRRARSALPGCASPRQPRRRDERVAWLRRYRSRARDEASAAFHAAKIGPAPDHQATGNGDLGPGGEALEVPAGAEIDLAAWDALAGGLFEVFSSDHAPFRFAGPDGKQVAGEHASFDRVPNGIPGIETRLALLFSEGVGRGRIGGRVASAATLGQEPATGGGAGGSGAAPRRASQGVTARRGRGS